MGDHTQNMILEQSMAAIENMDAIENMPELNFEESCINAIYTAAGILGLQVKNRINTADKDILIFRKKKVESGSIAFGFENMGKGKPECCFRTNKSSDKPFKDYLDGDYENMNKKWGCEKRSAKYRSEEIKTVSEFINHLQKYVTYQPN